MAAPELPAEISQLRDQLLRDQAPSVRTRSNYFDPAIFASRHARPYSSRRLSLETLMEMRTDAILRFSQLVALVPIFTGKWRIECVAEDQRVLMADGSLKAVQDVRPGDEVLASDGEKITRDRVSNAWPVGERDCYRITFSDGREIVVTGNHPIYGWRGWKFAGELQPGDPVCFAHETPEQGGALSRDDAFLLALWLAEGSKRKASYEVCCGTPGVLERLREICDERGWTYTSMRDGLVALVGARWRREGDTPKNLLREHGCWGQSTDTITVPHAVMSAPSGVVAEFLATYVACDGGATSTGIKIVSTSERMARDLQILFARIGAHAYVQSRQPDHEGHARQWFVVVGSIGVKRLTDLAHVYGKHERIVATISERARDSAVPPEWLDELPAPEYAGVGRPTTALKAARAAGFNPRRGSWASLRAAAGSAEACGADELARRLDGQLAWTRVERVKMVGRRLTYDLEVADKHTFFVDGVLTHNCANAQKAAFVDHALRQIIGRLIVQFYESWNFGFQAIVKQFALMDPGWVYFDKETEKSKPVWDGGPQVPALVWDSFVTLSPKMVSPVWTQGGSFNGIALSTANVGGYYFPFPTTSLAPGDIVSDVNTGGGGVAPSGPFSYNVDSQNAKKVDVDHSLWVCNERDAEWGSVWGRSRLSYAYKFWWSYEMTLGILNRSVERKGDPTIIVSYPQGTSMVSGNEVQNQIIAQQIGQAARSGAVLTVPSEVWGEDVGTANQASKWRIEYLKAEEQFDKLQSVLHYLDTMKIRAMAISELSFAEGSGGSSSRNVAAVTGERSFEIQVLTQVEWDDIINRYMIPQLSDANYPELRDVPARKVTSTFGQDEAQLAADILRSFANSNADLLPIDKPALLERFQIDSISGNELEKWRERLVQQAQNSAPPPTPAQPGGRGAPPSAGVTDTGFYYDAPERIELSDDALLAALPKTKHYADSAVLAQTRLVRRLWHGMLSSAYEDFASHVADSSDIGLARPGPAEAARAAVDGWRWSADRAAKVIKATAVALSKIVARAGVLELSSSRVKAEFDPAAKQVDDWVTTNVAALVRHVDKTTRDQLRDFLATQLREGAAAPEIAKNIRAHFAEFPAWRSDMLARTEAMRFYNAGTLFAAGAAGAQVQALDAQNGPTDPECENRHGRIYDVGDAWQESVRVHPRDTLAFRIVPLGVGLSRHPRDEMGNVAARVDQEERVIHLAEGLDAATESRYLQRAVDWLIAP